MTTTRANGLSQRIAFAIALHMAIWCAAVTACALKNGSITNASAWKHRQMGSGYAQIVRKERREHEEKKKRRGFEALGVLVNDVQWIIHYVILRNTYMYINIYTDTRTCVFENGGAKRTYVFCFLIFFVCVHTTYYSPHSFCFPLDNIISLLSIKTRSKIFFACVFSSDVFVTDSFFLRLPHALIFSRSSFDQTCPWRR